MPAEGFEFFKWTENGVNVSTDAVYTFTVTCDRNLVANFTNPNFIFFADPNVEAICVANWDTNGDGLLSYDEAAAVTYLDNAFQNNTEITSFDELQYFTGLTYLGGQFCNCNNLTSITLPESIVELWGVFYECYNLNRITVLTMSPPYIYDMYYTFYGVDRDIPIAVPCNTTSSYQNANGWNEFHNYQESGYCIYEITAIANNEEAGTVSGDGSYQRGQTCTLIATPNEGRNFVCWIENDQEVSTEATYYFTATESRFLIAVFSAIASEIIVFADSIVEAICVANWDFDSDGLLSYGEAASVTNLGNAFRQNTEITSFDELQYFTRLSSILDRAFEGCSSLVSVTLPEGITTIGYRAFRDCVSLTGDLVIPNSVTIIDDAAFSGCSGFTGNLVIGDGVTTIGGAAFSGCSGFTGDLVIPDAVTSIEYCAFNGCSGFTSLTIGTGLEWINTPYLDGYSYESDNAFYNCIGITTLNYNAANCILACWYDKAEAIFSVFASCSSLTTLNIGENVQSIPNNAFKNCNSLIGNLDLPNNLTRIGDQAFYNCYGLEGIVIGNSVETIGSEAFYNCSGLRGELTLPESLQSVGPSAFAGCNEISTVNYNAINCTEMGNVSQNVFADCLSLTHIRIGANVESIPNYAFKPCFLVTDMSVAAEVPPTIYSSTFGTVSRNIPVSVPYGSGEAYRTAQYWEEFFHITEDYSPNSYTYHWNVNVHQFADNMTVTGIIQIEGVEQAVPSLEIGAFCNGECRGRQLLTYYPQVDRYLVFLMLYGEDGDMFSFKLYDHEAGEELTAGCASVLTFEADAIVGNFLDPYVFNFTDMQLTQFSEGWNWWSTYVEQANIDGLSQLEESLGDNGITIRSQVGYTDYYAGYGWYGSLSSINNESSYKIKTSAPCVAAMAGGTAIPSQHPITLNQGWTWMGYLPSFALDINTALDGLDATQGDKVKSQQGYSDYYPGYGWFGSLNTIEPGMGLMYYSANGEAVTFTYPDNTRKGELKANITAENNHWKPNVFAYPDNMTVMAVVELDGEELSNENYELAAFAANGECRGSVKLTFAEPLHRYVAFLTISGKDAAELSFKLYNTETNEEYYDAEESLDFVANAMVGKSDDLYVVHFKGIMGMDEFANNVRAYPNPVNAGERFSIGLSGDVADIVRVEIINTLGMVETVCTSSRQTLTAPNVAGVYILRITMEGKGTVVRKLVVK